jgi:hypothetical protein
MLCNRTMMVRQQVGGIRVRSSQNLQELIMASIGTPFEDKVGLGEPTENPFVYLFCDQRRLTQTCSPVFL